jgi:hypothetical protein
MGYNVSGHGNMMNVATAIWYWKKEINICG